MLNRVRTSLYRLITTPKGDALSVVRLPKDLARRVNMTLGDPLCSAEEIERRRAGQEKLTKLRSGEVKETVTAPVRIAAPITIYFEKDRNARLFGRIKDVLLAKNLAFTELDVSTDEVAKAYAMREAHCKEDDLPIVFVATTPVGGYNDLVEWDVSGKLETAVYGKPS